MKSCIFKRVGRLLIDHVLELSRAWGFSRNDLGIIMFPNAKEEHAILYLTVVDWRSLLKFI